jgi:SAM-dependent methyltransferase
MAKSTHSTEFRLTAQPNVIVQPASCCLQSSPMNPEGAERHYRGQSGARYQQLKRAIPQPAIPWVARDRARKLARHIAPQDVVLEYGAGLGWNLAQLNCRGKLAFDLEDYIEPSIRAAGVEFIKDLHSIAEGFVDIVLCHHSLEHVMSPVEVLREIHRFLKPEGKLLLFVPDERGARYRSFIRDDPNHHLYSWNVQTLANLVEETGYQVIEAGLNPYGYDRFAATWANKLAIGETGFACVRALARLFKPIYEVRIIARNAKVL